MSSHGTFTVLMKLNPIPFNQVTIDDPFWSPKIEVNRTATIAAQHKYLQDTGRINNFLKAGGKMDGAFEGLRFNDSDVYKWLEAASYVLAATPDTELEREVVQVIEAVRVAQQADGYINTCYTLKEPQAKWKNLGMNHEMYCAGHLFEAAAAHYQATGKTSLLDIAKRFADHIDSIFGPGKRLGYCGHEEIELALVKLADVTGDPKYRALAKFFVDARGSRPSPFELEMHQDYKPTNLVDNERMLMKGDAYGGEYVQDHLPVREQSEVVGHAVRAMYLFSAVADLARDDETLIRALDNLWENLTLKRMYVTGGIGPSASNEGFTKDYDLPNDTAYAETCAAIGLVFWSHRMAMLHGDAKYADVMEQALYNGVISGVSQDGQRFFYVNPLDSDGSHHRQGWFLCACCPPNIARLLASLGGYVYARGGSDSGSDGTEPSRAEPFRAEPSRAEPSRAEPSVFVNLYISGTCRTKVGQKEIWITQKTDYPWSGEVELLVHPETAADFALCLRFPGWCGMAELFVNDERTTPQQENGYFILRRTWQPGDKVKLQMQMEPRLVAAHPSVKADVGRIAVCRGPLVYCLEQMDQKAPLPYVSLPVGSEMVAGTMPNVLGGIVVIRAEGQAIPQDEWKDCLYRPGPLKTKPTQLNFISYYIWDNREPGAMAVWIPVAASQG